MKRLVALASLLALAGFVLGVRAAEKNRAADSPHQASPADEVSNLSSTEPVFVRPVEPAPIQRVEPTSVAAAGARMIANPDGGLAYRFGSDAANADLRKQFLELMARRANRMTDDELQEQILELTNELSALEKEANSALDRVLGELAEIIKRHPGTAGARRAQMGLVTIQNAASTSWTERTLAPWRNTNNQLIRGGPPSAAPRNDPAPEGDE